MSEQSLKAALLAVESDDVDGLKARNDATHQALKRHWEGIENDQELWGF